FERGAVPHRSLAGLQVDLDAVLARDAAQPFAEGIERIARFREADAAAQAYPVQAPQDLRVSAFDLREQVVEAAEVVVLAIVVNHHAVEAIDDGPDTLGIALAQAAELAHRVGQLETRVAHPRVQPQTDRLVRGERRKAFELADRVED